MQVLNTKFYKISMAVMMAMLVSVLSPTSKVKAQGFQMPPAKVVVTKAESRMMAPQIELTGTVISLNNSRVSNEVAASVVWIADVGTAVKKGDVIARLDDRLLVLAKRRAEANLNRLKADMVFRQQDVERYSKLASNDNASKSRLAEIISRRDMLKHSIEDAEAILDKTQGDVARTGIKAPFPGHVVARLANVGEYLAIGEDVVRLVDTTHVEIVLPAPTSIKSYLKEGMMIAAHDDNVAGMFPIRTVVPVGDRVSRMMEVRLSLPADKWVVGSAVKVSLPKGNAQMALTVPRDAIVLKGSDPFVFKVGDDMRAQQVKIDVIAIVGTWVSFTGDIAEGDTIVIRGGERLRPGQSVVIDGEKSQTGN